jgi:hypothetical protein
VGTCAQDAAIFEESSSSSPMFIHHSKEKRNQLKRHHRVELQLEVLCFRLWRCISRLHFSFHCFHNLCNLAVYLVDRQVQLSSKLQ